MIDVDLFELPADHPGVADHEYRARRAAIAEVAARFRAGQPIPDVTYIEEEDDVWRTVSGELARTHERFACAAYLEGADLLALRRDRVPQLEEVSQRLRALTGFRVEPVGGLVPTRVFYGSLADQCFLSTQYVRHHSVPFYTPEPDVIHEVVGHCNSLAHPAFAELYRLAGQAAQRCHTDEALEFFSRVFWFTLEFGVVWERGELRTYGAGLLSSYAEIELFRDAEIRPLDIASMGSTAYDITRYQPLLFAAASLDHAVETLSTFFERYDDDAFARLADAA
ncbi:MAG: phenylalanine-4-hydroxylase [Acidimicrobiaceae bacterium]|nr:phenylalanine-4-hydroxylase [Acidimicrobiaceae bacterium]